MKKIIIICSESGYKRALSLQSTLLELGYDTIIMQQDHTNVYSYVADLDSSDCQLIISVDGFGFEEPTIENGAHYNYSPVNVIAVLYDSIGNYDFCFNKKINYTISFLCFDAFGEDYIRSNFPHVYHAKSISSVDDIISYLDDFEFRY